MISISKNGLGRAALLRWGQPAAKLLNRPTVMALQHSIQDHSIPVLSERVGGAQVVQVQQKETGRRYALKVVDKHLVLKHKQTEYISNERKLLDQFDYEGIVRLHFTFQDAASLYFGLELCPNGGDLDVLNLHA